jgi:cytochrome P450
MGAQETMSVDDAKGIFVSSEAYTDEVRWHEAATLLRREAPVSWVEGDYFNPFWAITRHADVLEVELHPAEFLNEPRTILGNKEGDARRATEGHLVKSLVQMDEPDHRVYRNVTADWFLPKNLAKLDEPSVGQLARDTVDRMAGARWRVRLRRDIAMQYPLQVILAILGLPESDYGRMLTLTQELFGAADEDLSRGKSLDDLVQVINDFFVYFTALTEERRDAHRRPRVHDRQCDHPDRRRRAGSG